MKLIDKIKDIIFRIKDYDRLESDYCTALCYFTNNRMSKPNYKIDVVKEVIIEAIGEYMDEGYKQAQQDLKADAIETTIDGKVVKVIVIDE